MPARATASVRRDDFTRDIVLDCEKDGTITFRNRKDTIPDGVLPFFSVNTAAEAETLIIRLCKRQYELHPRTRDAHYRVDVSRIGSETEPMTGFKLLSLDDVETLADIFRNAWFDMRERDQL